MSNNHHEPKKAVIKRLKAAAAAASKRQYSESKRRTAYKRVLDKYHINPNGKHSSASEDAASHLSGESPIEQYCVVTTANGDGGGPINYAYAHDTTLDAAIVRANSNIADDIYPEAPIEIIDLDTGKSWKPNWQNIIWTPKE